MKTSTPCWILAFVWAVASTLAGLSMFSYPEHSEIRVLTSIDSCLSMIFALMWSALAIWAEEKESK